jgi:hypothetical protein
MIEVLVEPAESIGREAARTALAMIAGNEVSNLTIPPHFATDTR